MLHTVHIVGVVCANQRVLHASELAVLGWTRGESSVSHGGRGSSARHHGGPREEWGIARHATAPQTLRRQEHCAGQLVRTDSEGGA